MEPTGAGDRRIIAPVIGWIMTGPHRKEMGHLSASEILRNVEITGDKVRAYHEKMIAEGKAQPMRVGIPILEDDDLPQD